jgi:hypothetical protein
MDYIVGNKMEVCNKEKRYVDSYYESTIVSCLDNGKYVVRYKNFLKDDKFDPLKVTIAEGVLYIATTCPKSYQITTQLETDDFRHVMIIIYKVPLNKVSPKEVKLIIFKKVLVMNHIFSIFNA